MMTRLLALLVAVIVPPVAVMMIRGMQLGFWINLIGFGLAQGLFWFVFAGPGFALWGAMIAHAVLIALLLRQRGKGEMV